MRKWKIHLHSLVTKEHKTIFMFQKTKPSRADILKRVSGRKDWYIVEVKEVGNG